MVGGTELTEFEEKNHQTLQETFLEKVDWNDLVNGKCKDAWDTHVNEAWTDSMGE